MGYKSCYHYFSRLSFDRGLRIPVCGPLCLLHTFCFFCWPPHSGRSPLYPVSYSAFCVLLFIKITHCVVCILRALLNDELAYL